MTSTLSRLNLPHNLSDENCTQNFLEEVKSALETTSLVVASTHTYSFCSTDAAFGSSGLFFGDEGYLLIHVLPIVLNLSFLTSSQTMPIESEISALPEPPSAIFQADSDLAIAEV